MVHSIVLVDDEKQDEQKIIKFDFRSKKDRDTYYDMYCDKMFMHLAYGDDETNILKIKCGHRCKNKPCPIKCGKNDCVHLKDQPCVHLFHIIEMAKKNGIKEQILMPELSRWKSPKRKKDEKKK